jgi:hypothetical protein
MTYDSSIMSALRSLISPVNVLTAYGTSLPVLVEAPFLLPPFLFLIFCMFLVLR